LGDEFRLLFMNRHAKRKTSLLVFCRRAWPLVLVLLVACDKGSPGPRSAAEKMAAGIAIGDAMAPIQEVAVWVVDRQGRPSSYWVRGKFSAMGVIAASPGFLMPVGSALWQWQVREEPVTLCDCRAWEAEQFKGDCPGKLDVGIRQTIALVDRVTGEEVLLPPGPGLALEEGQELSEFQTDVKLIASVGPYLFIRTREEGLLCGSTHNQTVDGFLVFNMETREPVELLTEWERAGIAENEQQAAFELARGDNLASVDSPEDLALKAIVPGFTMGHGLTLFYEFSVSATFAESDGRPYASYTRQISVPAQQVPAALLPFMVLPALARQFVLDAPGVTLGGWMPIYCPPGKRPALQAAYLDLMED
jgi:hypothetical protein